MERGRAYRRHHRRRVIQKKLWILTHCMSWTMEKIDPSRKGKLAKGKVHCSCWSCSPKRAAWGPRDNERARLEAMECELRLYFNYDEFL